MSIRRNTVTKEQIPNKFEQYTPTKLAQQNSVQDLMTVKIQGKKWERNEKN